MDTLRRRIVLAAPVAGLSALAAAGNAAFIDAAPEIDAVLDRFFAAYTRMDVDALTALLSPDIEFEDPTFRLRLRGRDAMRTMMLDTAARYSAVAVTPHTRVVCGDRAATEQTIAAMVRTDESPARRVAVRGASFFEFSAGRIRRWTDYYDARTFTEQMRAWG